MRFAVFVFSLLLIFVPTYAHALAFVPSAVGMVARSATGQAFKIATKRGLLKDGLNVATSKKGLFATAAASCAANKQCKDAVGDALEQMMEDEHSEEWCDGRIRYWGNDGVFSYNYFGFYGYDSHLSYAKAFENMLYERNKRNSEYKDVKPNIRAVGPVFGDNGAFQYIEYDYIDGWGIQRTSSKILIKKECTEHKDFEREQQKTFEKIINNLEDNDINQIVNNYYNDIDIDKYCGGSDNCNELSKEFGDDVINNKNKYDVDEITKANCVVENGKIVSCDNAKRDKDDDDDDTKDSKNNDKKEDDEDNTQESKDNKCPAYLKWLCDFDLEFGDEETQIEVQDQQLDFQSIAEKQYVKFSSTCPVSPVWNINWNLGFYTVNGSITFPMDIICQGLSMMKILVVMYGFIRSIEIIGNGT